MDLPLCGSATASSSVPDDLGNEIQNKGTTAIPSNLLDDLAIGEADTTGTFVETPEAIVVPPVTDTLTYDDRACLKNLEILREKG